MRRRIKGLLILAFLVIVGILLIIWRSGSVSPTDVRAYSLDDLRSVKICRDCKCADLDRTTWPELIQHVEKLQSTLNVGSKGETGQNLYNIEFDWGKKGVFGLRIWTRPSIKGQVIATFEKERYGGTAYYGNYSANELKSWIDERGQPENQLKTVCSLLDRKQRQQTKWDSLFYCSLFPTGNITRAWSGLAMSGLYS